MDDFTKDMRELAQRFAELTNQALLTIAKSGNPETAILPQIMVSDFLPRNYLKAEIYIKSGGARGYVVLKRHKSGEGYRWLISDGYSSFIDLGLAAANLAEAKRVFSDFFRENQVVEICGYSRWWKGLV